VLAASDEPSAMREYGDKLSCHYVCNCAKDGDKLALQSLRTSMDYLGRGLASVAYVVDPEVFVIGGGVSKAGMFLVDLIKEYFTKYTPLAKNKPDIVLATLGNDAGIYGCARMVLE
jgi:glucokinase